MNALSHKVVTQPTTSLAKDRESLPAKTSILTTMLRRMVIIPYHTIFVNNVADIRSIQQVQLNKENYKYS